MRFAPAKCEVCTYCALVPEETIDNSVTRCAHCRRVARIIGSEWYAAKDVMLFEHLGAAIGDAGLTRPRAAELLFQLQSSRHPGTTLRQLVRALPSLGVVDVLIDESESSVGQAERILTTLLVAIVTSSHSGA